MLHTISLKLHRGRVGALCVTYASIKLRLRKVTFVKSYAYVEPFRKCVLK